MGRTRELDCMGCDSVIQSPYCHILFSCEKKMFKRFFGMCALSLACLLSGCGDDEDRNAKALIFGTCADYPPFEFTQDGKMVGFDIDFAGLVAEKLGKQAEFRSIAFSSILISVQNGSVDAAISGLGATAERKQNYDFSDPYYKESLAIVHKKDSPIKSVELIGDKKIACQLGSLHEKWLMKTTKAQVLSMDNMNQVTESVKAGHAAGGLMDTVNAKEFVKQSDELEYTTIVETLEDSDGFSIAVRQGSALLSKINDVIDQIKKSGELEALKRKWKLDD